MASFPISRPEKITARYIIASPIGVVVSIPSFTVTNLTPLSFRKV